MPHADLHVHTDRSDGTLTLEALPAAARRGGVAVVGVTDHDRVQPELPAPVTVRDGVTLVHGIELKVAAGDQRLDLLGYGVDPTAALTDEIERLQADRVERGRAIVEKVESELGVELEVEVEAGLGRPHIARAIEAHPEAPYDARGAFEALIGDGRPCFVARAVTPFEAGLDLLREACALVGLAHPLRYDDPGAAVDRAAALDAIERWYPYAAPVDPSPVERAIECHDLLPTGGSDAHGTTLGVEGVSAADYGAIAARLPAPSVGGH